ncbi:hypothetical protein ACLI4R_17560 [Natrialbaceae archaeon A-chndr2]
MSSEWNIDGGSYRFKGSHDQPQNIGWKGGEKWAYEHLPISSTDDHGQTIDARDEIFGTYGDVKTCLLHYPSGSPGKIVFRLRQHSLLLQTNGDYIMLLVELDRKNLEWRIVDVARQPAHRVHTALDIDDVNEADRDETEWRMGRNDYITDVPWTEMPWLDDNERDYTEHRWSVADGDHFDTDSEDEV